MPGKGSGSGGGTQDVVLWLQQDPAQELAVTRCLGDEDYPLLPALLHAEQGKDCLWIGGWTQDKV